MDESTYYDQGEDCQEEEFYEMEPMEVIECAPKLEEFFQDYGEDWAEDDLYYNEAAPVKRKRKSAAGRRKRKVQEPEDDEDEEEFGDDDEYEDEVYVPPGESAGSSSSARRRKRPKNEEDDLDLDGNPDEFEEDDSEDANFEVRFKLLNTALTVSEFVVRKTCKEARKLPEKEQSEEDELKKRKRKREEFRIRNIYGCMFCGFAHEKNIWLNHLRTNHADQSLVFCDVFHCQMPCKDEERLQAHKEHVHTPKLHSCPVCQTTFRFPYLLKTHMETHMENREKKKEVCTYCGKEFGSKKGVKEHEAKHHTHNLQYKCDWEGCSREFFTQNQLRIHRLYHTGDMPFVCSYCGAGFPVKSRLTQHENVKHNPNYKPDSKPREKFFIPCEICSKQVDRRIMKRHLRIHDPELKAFCSYCGKEFANDESKRRHELIHQNKKDYACKFCGKAFVQKCNMQAHERTHTGERPYACRKCGEGFIQGTNRNKHEMGCNGMLSARAQKR